ncbi:E4, partial [Macaca mulatta papillomavirus 7]|uniref:E4 n=1 Tax=Macaca mulatta papillomavirus 7 TaxID=2364644 RepID=UPI000EB63DF1
NIKIPLFLPLLPALQDPPTGTPGKPGTLPPPTPRPQKKSVRPEDPTNKYLQKRLGLGARLLPRQLIYPDDDEDDDQNKENIPVPPEQNEEEPPLPDLHRLLKKWGEYIDQLKNTVSQDLDEFKQKLGIQL